MRRAAGVVLLAMAALVQVTWAPRFEVLGAFPNLVLVTVVASACLLGPRAAMAWACGGGLLLDLASSGPIGPHALALLPGVYATGLWTRDLERVNGLHVALAAAVSTVMYSFILVLADGLLGLAVPPAQTVAELGVAAAAYNALPAPFVFEALRRFQPRPRPTA
jgi:rod shape-determining protein MreD